MKQIFLFCLLLCLPVLAGTNSPRAEITVSGTRFLMDGKPFPFTGVSFFNAIYNPTFNQSSEERGRWMDKFSRYGINVLRLWGQWDTARGFVDAGPGQTLFETNGSLRAKHLATLKDILKDAAGRGMVIELALFAYESRESGIILDPAAARLAVENLTRELLPYRNIVFQIWNEYTDDQVVPLVKAVRAIDPKRLVSNAPGWPGDLGDPPENQVLDFLTPHTSRQEAGRHWEIAPVEIEYLLTRYRKPVVDDEPARNGTGKFGGPRGATSPYDHILQIARVWQLGGYIVYHHDMFQTGYGTPAVPPSGIPDPEFNPYHRQVFEFIALRDRYQSEP